LGNSKGGERCSNFGVLNVLQKFTDCGQVVGC
jgi:hypothetical protein